MIWTAVCKNYNYGINSFLDAQKARSRLIRSRSLIKKNIPESTSVQPPSVLPSQSEVHQSHPENIIV